MVQASAGVPILAPGLADRGHAGADGQFAGDEVRPARRAACLGVVVGEQHAFFGELVEVRRPPGHHAAVVGADVPHADVVAHDDDDVGLLAAGGRRGRRGRFVGLGNLVAEGSGAVASGSAALAVARGLELVLASPLPDLANCDEQAMMPPIADRARQAATVVLSLSMNGPLAWRIRLLETMERLGSTLPAHGHGKYWQSRRQSNDVLASGNLPRRE